MTVESVSDETTVSGTGTVAQLQLDDWMGTVVDVIWDVDSVDGTIHVEVSNVSSPSSGDWRTFETFSTTNVGRDNGESLRLASKHVRAYADGTDFADGDVNLVEVAARVTHGSL